MFTKKSMKLAGLILIALVFFGQQAVSVSYGDDGSEKHVYRAPENRLTIQNGGSDKAISYDIVEISNDLQIGANCSVLHDDFEDGDMKGWGLPLVKSPFHSSSTGVFSIHSPGLFNSSFSLAGLNGCVSPNVGWGEDFVLEFAFRMPTDINGDFDVIFLQDDDDAIMIGFYCEGGDNKKDRILLLRDGQTIDEVLVPTTLSSGSEHRVKIEKELDSVSVYLDGSLEPYMSYSDQRIIDGGSHFYIRTWFDALIDDFCFSSSGPAVARVAPPLALTINRFDLTFLGANISDDTFVSLHKEGEADIPGVYFSPYETADDTFLSVGGTWSFDVTGASPGLWQVVATSPDGKTGYAYVTIYDKDVTDTGDKVSPVHFYNDSDKLMLLDRDTGALVDALTATFDPAKPGFIICHGWNKDSSTELPTWVTDIARSVSVEKPELNVFAWEWLENAQGILAPAGKIDMEASALSAFLIAAQVDESSSLRFFGFSLGGGVAAKAAEQLCELGYANVKRVTIADAPEVLLAQLGLSAVHLQRTVEDLTKAGVSVDNYITQFGEVYPHAINFSLRPITNSERTANQYVVKSLAANHYFAWAWFENTIVPQKSSMPLTKIPNGLADVLFTDYYRYEATEVVDFWKGVDDAGFKFPAEQFPAGTVAYPKYVERPSGLSDFSVFEFEEPRMLDTYGDYITVNVDILADSSTWEVNGIAQSHEESMYVIVPGTITVPAPGLNSVAADDPEATYLFKTFDIPSNVNVMSFDYKFEAHHEGDMVQVFLDDDMVWAMSATDYNEGIMRNSGWIDISSKSGQTVKICFALIRGTDAQACMALDNLTFAEKVLVGPTTINVPSDYGTIQEAIDASADGDKIVVSPGTYNENIDFKGKNIVLSSIAPSNPVATRDTIIDGGSVGSVVTFAGTETSDAALTGFVITNGNATFSGGGVRGNGAQPTIQNCIIADNTSGLRGGGIEDCDGLIANNIIVDNRSQAGGGLSGCDGTIANNTICANITSDTGGGLDTCLGVIVNNIIWGNVAVQDAQVSNSSIPTYCCIQDDTFGGTNIATNPKFSNVRLLQDILVYIASIGWVGNLAEPWEDNDFSLDASSPCIDSGKLVSAVVEDFEGNARGLDAISWETCGDGSNYDIGAFEYSQKIEMGSIAGELTDNRSGEPVADADVELRDGSDNVIISGKSDALGQFAFAGILPGEYYLVLKHPGYETKHWPQGLVRIEYGSKMDYDIPLAALASNDCLGWSTTVSSAMLERASDLVMDDEGNVYVTGWTTSTILLPDVPLSDYSKYGSTDKAFVVKYNKEGKAVWQALVGGSGSDKANGITVGYIGEQKVVLIIGQTTSSDFPLTDKGEYSGGDDIFASILQDQGARGSLEASGLFGEEGADIGNDILLLDNGVVYAVGTLSSDIDDDDRIGAVGYRGKKDVVVARAHIFLDGEDMDGEIDWWQYLGGTSNDEGQALAVDELQNLYVTGVMDDSDAYAAKIDPVGTLLWSKTFAGNRTDVGQDIVVGRQVYVTGYTNSTDSIANGGLSTAYNGGAFDGFVSCLTRSGSIAWTTYLGGKENDKAHGIGLDAFGNVYVGGETSSSDFPGNANNTSIVGKEDAFLTKISPVGQSVSWTKLLGGASADLVNAVVSTSKGNVYVAGNTDSTISNSGSQFPTYGPFSKRVHARGDGFVAAVVSDCDENGRTDGERIFPGDCYKIGDPLTVRILITPSKTHQPTCIAVEEIVPRGWYVIDPGDEDFTGSKGYEDKTQQANGTVKIKWGVIGTLGNTIDQDFYVWYKIAPIPGQQQDRYFTGVVSSDGVSREISNTFLPECPPKAAFKIEIKPSPVDGPYLVCFTDQSTNSPTKWHWDFGDGTTSDEQNPCHEYSSIGNYTVTLLVTNDSGTDTAYGVVTLTAPTTHFAKKKYVYRVDRTYDQIVSMPIVNGVGAHEIEVQIVDTAYRRQLTRTELQLEFVAPGGNGSPQHVGPNTTFEVPLSINAADAMWNKPYAPLEALLIVDGREVQYASIEIWVNEPDYRIAPPVVTSECTYGVWTIEFKNEGTSEIDDLGISTDPAYEELLIFNPSFQHMRLQAGQTQQVMVFADMSRFSEFPKPFRPKVYFLGAGRPLRTVQLEQDFACCGSSGPYAVILKNRLIIQRSLNWYCTNKPNFDTIFRLPGGFDHGDIEKAHFVNRFEPRSKWKPVQPHSVNLSLNERAWQNESIRNTIPDGVHSFPVIDPALGLITTPFILPGERADKDNKNIVTLEMVGANPGHYVVETDFAAHIALDQVTVWVCASSQQEAETLADLHPYYLKQPDWNIDRVELRDAANVLIDGNVCQSIEIGRRIYVRAYVNDPQLGKVLIAAHPDNGDPSFLLDTEFHLPNGGVAYEGTWVPMNLKNPMGDPTIITVYGGACHNDSEQVCVTLIPPTFDCSLVGFTPSNSRGRAPLPMRFWNDTVVHPTIPTAWQWDFGDPASPENTSTDQHGYHVYSNPGTYTVTLKASQAGLDCTSTKVIVVQAPSSFAGAIRSFSTLDNITLQTERFCKDVKVTIEINPGNPAPKEMKLKEVLPEGWAISNLQTDISDGGQWNSVERSITWTLNGTTTSVNYVPSHVLSGVSPHVFAGELTAGGMVTIIGGLDRLLEGCCHPADSPPVGDCNKEIDIDELTGYCAEYCSGTIDCLEGIASAAVIWKLGEKYEWSPGSPYPYVSVYANNLNTISKKASSSTLALREMPERYVPGKPIQVTIEVIPSLTNPPIALVMEDQVPEGWSVSDISEGGVLDLLNNKVKWGPIFGRFNRTFTYTVLPPLDARGSRSWHGAFCADDYTLILGDVTIEEDVLNNLQRADVIQDGKIDKNDLFQFASEWQKKRFWGDQDARAQQADLDSDQVVSEKDLMILLHNWHARTKD